MVKVKINDIYYKIPTSWKEVDISLIINCDSPKTELSLLSGIPEDLLNRIPGNYLFSLYQLIEFVNDPESIIEILEEVDCVNIEMLPYEKFEQAKAGIDEKLYKTLYNLSMVYYPEEKNSVRQMSLGFKILNQITVFLSHYEEMFKDEPENDEIAAGIDRVQAFGVWGTVYNLAGRDLLKMESVLQLPAINVYTALFYSYRERKFMEAYQKIKTPNIHG